MVENPGNIDKLMFLENTSNDIFHNTHTQAGV